jgi:hypothetical protein
VICRFVLVLVKSIKVWYFGWVGISFVAQKVCSKKSQPIWGFVGMNRQVEGVFIADADNPSITVKDGDGRKCHRSGY